MLGNQSQAWEDGASTKSAYRRAVIFGFVRLKRSLARYSLVSLNFVGPPYFTRLVGLSTVFIFLIPTVSIASLYTVFPLSVNLLVIDKAIAGRPAVRLPFRSTARTPGSQTAKFSWPLVVPPISYYHRQPSSRASTLDYQALSLAKRKLKPLASSIKRGSHHHLSILPRHPVSRHDTPDQTIIARLNRC